MLEGTIKYENGHYALVINQDSMWVIGAYRGGRLARHNDSVGAYIDEINQEIQRREYKPKIREILLVLDEHDYRKLEIGDIQLFGYRIVSADQSYGEIRLALEQISEEEIQKLGQRLNVRPYTLAH